MKKSRDGCGGRAAEETEKRDSEMERDRGPTPKQRRDRLYYSRVLEISSFRDTDSNDNTNHRGKEKRRGRVPQW